MNNSNKNASAGKRGDKVRSDCYIEIELASGGGLKLDIQSKVNVMYGESIHNLINELCSFFQFTNGNVLVEDNGALPFVIAARFESAIKKLKPTVKKEYLPPLHKNNSDKTTKDRLRRSRLYLPGNEPKFFVNAGLHKPDGIILDLEDSVAPSEKDSARYLVRNVLRAVDFYGAERMVRINQLPAGLEDLKCVVPHNPHILLIPKCETAQQIKEVEKEVLKIKKAKGLKYDVYFMPIIESALGAINSYEIAAASKYNCALTIGLEDYTADLGAQRTNEGKESFFARTMVVNAAKAAGIQAIDTVFSDVSDMEALRQSVLEAKGLGFEGKGCIHPRQIQVIHEAFAPEKVEIDKAMKIVMAFDDALAKGLGVVSLGSKMIDAPIVKRAHRTIELAILNKLIPADWKSALAEKTI
jgi:citrate lyase subunit beta/citryl-CoA lyase